MKALVNHPSHPVNARPAGTSIDPLEEQLIAMLKDGICDLYTAVSVLKANGHVIGGSEKNVPRRGGMHRA